MLQGPEREPMLVHVKVPLLGHHTSGVRSEWYRDDLEKHERIDPLPRLKKLLQSVAVTDAELDAITKECEQAVERDFEQAKSANDPAHDTLHDHILAPTDITEEVGVREPEGKEPVVMVDAALFAVDEILKKHPYGLRLNFQDGFHVIWIFCLIVFCIGYNTRNWVL